MPKITVLGGGFAGVSAAACARKAGAKVVLVERTDQLLGVGLHSGSTYNDGRVAAIEELRAMGGAYIFVILETPPVLTHPRTDMTWADVDELTHRPTRNTHIFHCMKAETAIRQCLQDIEVELIFANRAVDVEVGKAQDMRGDRLLAVILEKGMRLEADAFVDCTGSAGGVWNCVEYGYGCVECMLRCNSFGDRVSIATKAGAPELRKIRNPTLGGGFGALTSACSFYDGSIDPQLLASLKKDGKLNLEVPAELRDFRKIGLSTHFPFDPSQVKVIRITYPGFVKASGIVFMPLENVRKMPGFENARFSDPLGGGVGNAVRFMSMAPRENSLRVCGFRNLFVGGEKSGPMQGVAECIVSGAVAGYNAARCAFGKEPLVIPRTTIIGDFIAYVQEMMQTEKGLMQTYSLGGSQPYRRRMAEKGWWAKTVEQAIDEAEQRVAASGLTGVFARALDG